jgi:hypothetical protein
MQAKHDKQLAEAQADKKGLIDFVRQLAVPNGNLPYAVQREATALLEAIDAARLEQHKVKAEDTPA